MKVTFKRFSQHARLPTKATPGSACCDVYSAKSVMLEPGVTKPIKTDFKQVRHDALSSFTLIAENVISRWRGNRF